MARFRFRLQPVLRQRELAERDEQLRVAEIEQQRLRLEDMLRTCQERISDEQRTLNGLVCGSSIDPAAARAQGAAIIAARAEAQRLALELAGVYKRLEAARGVLAKAAMHRRSMELLRDSHREKWKQEINRAEDLALDELAVLRASRRSEEQL